MTEPLAPRSPADTVATAPANDDEQPGRPEPAAAPRRKMGSRIGGVYTALIAGIVVLVVVLIFIIQNAHAVAISFLGAHLHLSLAVALLLAAIAGAVIMAIAGTARIAQLRHLVRSERRKPNAG
jgi:uncharacterized integral membrane protein